MASKGFLDLESGDRVRDGFYEMASGLWPRFTRYEVREKDGRQYICPGDAAQPEMYDPWQVHHELSLGRVDGGPAKNSLAASPYTRFLSFVDALGIDDNTLLHQEKSSPLKVPKLTVEQAAVLCDWCGEYGLLGILFHEVKMFRLPYIEHHPEGNIYKSIAFYKKQGRWWGDSIHVNLQGQQSQKALTCSRLDWETGRVELESYASSSLFTDQAEKFDWSDPHWIEKHYFPFANNIVDQMTGGAWQDVWRDYCEPVEFFVTKAIMLARALKLVAQDVSSEPYAQGIGQLTVLIGEAPVSYGLINGKVSPKFRTPSLLSAYSLMALEGAAAGLLLRQCESESCRQWFTSRRSNAKFCSPACNTAQQQRKCRRRKKAGTERPSARFCAGCGLSLAGKRPQAKFCSTTCGNTFRKRQQRAKKASIVA